MIEAHYFEPPGKVLGSDVPGRGHTEMLVKGFVRRHCGCMAWIGYVLPLPADGPSLAVSLCEDEDHEAIMLRYTARHQASHTDRPELEECDALDVAKLLLEEAFDAAVPA